MEEAAVQHRLDDNLISAALSGNVSQKNWTGDFYVPCSPHKTAPLLMSVLRLETYSKLIFMIQNPAGRWKSRTQVEVLPEQNPEDDLIGLSREMIHYSVPEVCWDRQKSGEKNGFQSIILFKNKTPNFHLRIQ